MSSCSSLLASSTLNIQSMFVNYKKLFMDFVRLQELGTPNLVHFFASVGFLNSKSDTSLFLRHQSGNIIYLLVYVDDIIITSNNPIEIKAFLKHLADRFSLKDLGTLSYFLGVEATYTSSGLFLSQRKYI